MQKFRLWLTQKMAGRYGIDRLYSVLILGAMVFALLSVWASSWFSLPELALFAFAIYRFFSKNLDARRRENEWLLRQFNRVRYVKTKRYRKCPGCGTILCLPYRRGTHTVRCPRCDKIFDVKYR